MQNLDIEVFRPAFRHFQYYYYYYYYYMLNYLVSSSIVAKAYTKPTLSGLFYQINY